MITVRGRWFLADVYRELRLLEHLGLEAGDLEGPGEGRSHPTPYGCLSRVREPTCMSLLF